MASRSGASRCPGGGVNSSPVIHGDQIICVHGKENIDTTEEGRMVSIKIPADYDVEEQLVLEKESETWRNRLVMFSSSPVLANGRVFQITKTGNLACVNADTGAILWEEKLGADNIHSSPCSPTDCSTSPMNDGVLHIGKPTDEGWESLHRIELEGNCLGAPVIADGRLYLHTTKKLYCFEIGIPESPGTPPPWSPFPIPVRPWPCVPCPPKSSSPPDPTRPSSSRNWTPTGMSSANRARHLGQVHSTHRQGEGGDGRRF